IVKTTEQITDKKGTIGSGQTIELMESDGREIQIQGVKDDPFIGASQGTWLADGATVAYLIEALKPRLLFEIHTIQTATGKSAKLFGDHMYAAVAWDAAHNSAIAIERDKGTEGEAELVSLDLAHETRKELLPLDQFQGQLTLSPSRRRVAF